MDDGRIGFFYKLFSLILLFEKRDIPHTDCPRRFSLLSYILQTRTMAAVLNGKTVVATVLHLNNGLKRSPYIQLLLSASPW